MSLKFIVLYRLQFFLKKNINLILEKNMFDEFIVQRYTKSNIKFIFYNNINFNLLKNIYHYLKDLSLYLKKKINLMIKKKYVYQIHIK